MMIQSRVSGDVIEIGEEGGRALIDAGIYNAAKPTPAPVTKKPAPEKSTKVEPLTTEDMPSPPKKVK